MDFQTNDRVSITLEEDGVAQVRFIRADKMNALDSLMFETMIAAGDAFQAQPGVRAVVLSGEGRAFCAGLDLSNFGNAGSGNTPTGGTLADRTHGDSNRAQQVATQWRKLKVPVIAAIQGGCIGAGVDMTSACDIRYATQDAFFQIAEINIGMG